MLLIPSADPKLFRSFGLAQHPNQFLQSPDWGEFQKKLGRSVYHYLVIDEEVATAEQPTFESILSTAQIIKMPLLWGYSYYYLPRGPVVYLQIPVPDQNEMWQTLVYLIRKKYAKKDRVLFLRLDPGILEADKTELRTIISSRYPVEHLRKSIQPSNTLVLDLASSDEVLLNSMHQKTRYNIRLAEKKGISITTGWTKQDVADFWKLLEATTEREQFKSHPKEYYDKMVETLGGDWTSRDSCRVKFYRASFEGKTLAINLMILYGDTVTYLHGGSSNEGRNLMAPYLLHWQAIKDAKVAGASYYDFWGIAPTDDPKHPWAGFTRFKKGFGGRVVKYWGADDVVYHSLWYLAYNLLKKHH